jgi:uncharacterized membrane protein (DUF106 family)
MIGLIFASGNKFVELIQTPPHTLWFIIIVSIAVSLFSTLLNKLLVDNDMLQRQQETINDHNKRKKELLKLSETDVKKYSKAYPKFMRRDASVKQMQQKMSMSRLKPTCFTFIPMIVFFYVIRTMYTGPSGIQMPVAKPPMNIMDNQIFSLAHGMHQSEFFSVIRNIPILEGFMGFSGFYFLCSLSLSTTIQKLLGISQTATGQTGGGGMFDTSSQQDLPDPKTLV